MGVQGFRGSGAWEFRVWGFRGLGFSGVEASQDSGLLNLKSNHYVAKVAELPSRRELGAPHCRLRILVGFIKHDYTIMEESGVLRFRFLRLGFSCLPRDIFFCGQWNCDPKDHPY